MGANRAQRTAGLRGDRYRLPTAERTMQWRQPEFPMLRKPRGAKRDATLRMRIGYQRAVARPTVMGQGPRAQSLFGE